MKTLASRYTERLSGTLSSFTLAQKVIAVLGTLALLMAGFMLVRWVAQPQYGTLFSNLSPSDASAVVEQLESAGTPYQLAGDGTTVMVPRDDVYRARIELSGEGLPGSSDGGYSLLDEQDLSTSQFKEQTDFKRAMEGELAKTIKSMKGVDGAIVHLALPEKEIFTDDQAPATASVLVSTKPGDDLGSDQVQAIVHLVAASVDSMDPDNVTVADSTGRLLSAENGDGAMAAGSREQYVEKIQNQYRQRVQAMLDRVVGPGNSTVQVSADVDFDKATVESRTYTRPGGDLALAQREDTETYEGMDAAGGGANGVVGPDGQMDGATGAGGNGAGSYTKSSTTSDNAIDTQVEQRETAPGSINRLNVAAVIERTAAANNNPREIQQMISSAVGIDTERGDTLRVSVLPFDTSAQQEASAELAEQEKAEAAAARMDMFRNIAIGAGLILALLLGWLHSRRRAKQRREATQYVVEQLRSEPVRSEPEIEPPATGLLSLGSGSSPEQQAREELIALVERQPEDVAALLRGWLVQR